MFIAMNRFQIALGREEDFVAVWKNRETYLDDVPGFQNFHLLRGATTDQHTLFASHSVWDSRAAFEAWKHSEAFRNAHRNAGDNKGIYLGHPHLELFESAL
jgi:heme-degrading monooxygenase HmoA